MLKKLPKIRLAAFAALVCAAYSSGGQQLATGVVTLGLLCWAGWRIVFALWRRRPRRTPRAMIAAARGFPMLFSRREPDTTGCFARLHPAWRAWLETNSNREEGRPADVG